MKHFWYAIIFCVAALSAYATPGPANLKVTAMRDANGQQYFHVTLDAITFDSTSHFVLYHIVRWQGAGSDTTNRTDVTILQSWYFTGNPSFDDYDQAFNPDHLETDFVRTYSYAVYADIEKWSRDTLNSTDDSVTTDLTQLVSGSLDSIYLYFSSVPDVNLTAHIGDTVKFTFDALASHGTPAITYSASASDNTVATAAIEPNGKLSCVVLGYGSTVITVKGTDAAGRGISYSFNISVATVYDTITVTLRDASTNALLPSGTTYYYLLSNSNNGIDSVFRGDTTNSSGSGTLTSSGVITIVFPKWKSYLRIGAEGYIASWVKSNSADSIDVNANGISYTVDLSAAAMHKISGTVTDASNNPVSGAAIQIWREFLGGYSSYVVDTATSDANGNYTMTAPEGDKLLGTDEINVYARDSKYYDNTQSDGPLSSLEDHSNVNFQFTQKIEGQYISCHIETPSGSTIRTNIIVTAHSLDDTIVVAADSIINNGWATLFLDPGRYILFAQADTGYQSGYYNTKGYAATWTQADTVVISSDHSASWDSLIIILKPDSSISLNGGNGSEIDGVVRDQSGNIADGAHLLLYQQISAPAGGNTSRLMYTTTADASGNYTFTKVPAGTYMVLVDIVSKPLYESGLITIKDTTHTVTQNITYNPDGVQETVQSMPTGMELAQNYPNPFTQTSDIGFTVSENNANVRVAVYNDMGREVGVIAEGRYAEGQYITHVDAAAYPAGVYNYVLNVNGKTESRRMIVVR